MKKILAYTSTAILLGAVIMLLPLRMFFIEKSEEGPITLAGELRTLSDLESLQKPNEAYNFDAIRSEPTDPFVGILAISFFVALVVYLLFRRQRPASSDRYPRFLFRP